MKRDWRPHRFVPLSQLMASDAWLAGSGRRGAAAQAHVSTNEGFQQGLERGYREGYESGLSAGREAGRQQGLQSGLREGAEQGRREALQAFERLAAPIDSMLLGLQRLQADYHSAMRKEVVQLVATVARQVIRGELALQPSQILAMVDESLTTLAHASDAPVEVILNPEDYKRIQELNRERPAHWNLYADATLEHGECRIRVGAREVDAGCRQRLAACMEQISEQLSPQGEDERLSSRGEEQHRSPPVAAEDHSPRGEDQHRSSPSEAERLSPRGESEYEQAAVGFGRAAAQVAL